MKKLIIILLMFLICYSCRQVTCPPCSPIIKYVDSCGYYTKLYDSLQIELSKTVVIAHLKLSSDSAQAMRAVNTRIDSLNNEWSKLLEYKYRTVQLILHTDSTHKIIVKAGFDSIERRTYLTYTPL